MASGQDSTPGAQTLLSHHHRVVDQALHGTIDEIIGDALLVIFGAPQALPDWAQRAVARAIEVQNAMAKVNAHNPLQRLPHLVMGTSRRSDAAAGDVRLAVEWVARAG